MARTRTWDVLINSGDTVSGRFMTEAQARKVVAQMHTDAVEYFPLTLVRYRSVADQTIIASETFEIVQEPEARAEPVADDYPEGGYLTPYDRDLPYEFQIDDEEEEEAEFYAADRAAYSSEA